MSSKRKLILDADGVFLDERPYWDAALATALTVHGLFDIVATEFASLCATAFEQLGMQRLAKQYGCNSNWDLAAVMVKALEDREVEQRVRYQLSDGENLAPLNLVRSAVEALAVKGAAWVPSDTARAVTDPLVRFGLDRNSESFGRMIKTYDSLLSRNTTRHGTVAPFETIEPVEVIRDTMRTLLELDHELWVCTGRSRKEILQPIDKLDLGELLPSGRIISHDDILWAQAQTKTDFLGKPHWFPLALAIDGFDGAVALLSEDLPLSQPQTPVYIGDAMADCSAANNYRNLGLAIDYVHVRSGVTSGDENALISGSASTMACVDKLSEFPEILAASAS